MPPFICPSPIILDQAFPRDEDVLLVVGRALGEIQGLSEKGDIAILLTAILKLFVLDFDFNRTGPYPLLAIIYDLLVNWCLQPNAGVYTGEVDSIQDVVPHPLPSNCEPIGNTVLWAQETGKLLHLHDAVAKPGEFFIGIACPHAFAGLQPCEYSDSDQPARKFPLVGPNDLAGLGDAFIWNVPNDIHRRHVSFGDAKKNVELLGGVVSRPSSGGSHYIVRFPGGNRPWVLDYNHDPVLDSHIKELVAIVNQPFEYIKTTLLLGDFPRRMTRIRASQ